MDRFNLFNKINKAILRINDQELKERLNCYISPIYLFLINHIDKKNELNFLELSTIEKLKVLPKKLSSKISLPYYKFINYVYSKKKIKQSNIIFYPVEITHLNQMVSISNHMKIENYLYVTNRLHIYIKLKKLKINSLFFDENKFRTNQKINFNKGLKKFISEIINDFDNKIFDFIKYCIVDDYMKIKNLSLEIIDKIRPKKIVVGYDITKEGRVISNIAKSRNILTFCIQHGSISGEPLDSIHIVDNYILYGKRAKNYLLKIGNNIKSLKVFGAPYLENILIDKKEESSYAKILDLNPKKKVVLIAFSGIGHCTSSHHFYLIHDSLVKLAKSNTDINFIIKLHRKDSEKNYYKIFNENAFSIPIINAHYKNQYVDIFDLIKISSLIITGSSTVAYESILFNKPVLTIDLKNEFKNVDFIDENCTFHVDKSSKLSETFKIAIGEDKSHVKSRIKRNASKFISEYFHKPYQVNSKNIADFILNEK